MKIGDLEILRANMTPNGRLAAPKAPEKDEGGFGQMLKDSLEKVNSMQKDAEKASMDLASGKSQDIHNTMIAVEKADVAFQLLMQVRNKIIAAYEEIHRMQV